MALRCTSLRTHVYRCVMSKDWFMRMVEGVADAAVLPVKVAAEIVAYGDPKDETLKGAIESNFKSAAEEAVVDAALNTETGSKK